MKDFRFGNIWVRFDPKQLCFLAGLQFLGFSKVG